jgi:hypothetical protein
MVNKEPLFRTPGIAVFDKIKTKYHMWDPKHGISYLVKLRPFLREFFLEAMQSYKLYFYTAANSAYAKMVIDILKLEMVNGFSQNPNTLKLIDNNFQ